MVDRATYFMKRLNEAHTILTDNEKRKLYDRFGGEFNFQKNWGTAK